MSRSGIKHLIQCRCILPTMKRVPDPPLHSFVVFSVINEDGTLVEKKASCNNCGVMHHIYEVCHSKIVPEAEGSSFEMTIEDVSVFIPDSVKNVLSSYNAELPDYEYVKFMIEENCVGAHIVLDHEFNEGRRSGKILKYKGDNKFEIEPFSRKEYLDGNVGR